MFLQPPFLAKGKFRVVINSWIISIESSSKGEHIWKFDVLSDYISIFTLVLILFNSFIPVKQIPPKRSGLNNSDSWFLTLLTLAKLTSSGLTHTWAFRWRLEEPYPTCQSGYMAQENDQSSSSIILWRGETGCEILWRWPPTKYIWYAQILRHLACKTLLCTDQPIWKQNFTQSTKHMWVLTDASGALSFFRSFRSTVIRFVLKIGTWWQFHLWKLGGLIINH